MRCRTAISRVLTWGLLGLLVSLGVAQTGCSFARIGDEDITGNDNTGNGNDPEKKPGVLKITPAETSVVLNGTPQQVVFRVHSSLLGDVTSAAGFSISDSSVGTFFNGKLSMPGTLSKGGAYKVYASYGGVTASAMLLVKVIAPDVVDPSAPVDAKDHFSGPPGGTAPDWMYPFDNTLMAPNVLQLGMQWRAVSGQTVFRIQVQGDTYERAFYVGSSKCPSGQCTWTIDDALWSEVGHAALGRQVQIVLSGSGGRGAVYGTAAPVTIHFAPEDVKGGLYYFSPTIRGIKRVPLGASKPVDFIKNGDETGCAGCHAVSRDGKKVAVEFGSGQTRVGSSVVDGLNPKARAFALRSAVSWNFAWFSPAGDKLITNWSGTLKIRDASNGNELGAIQPAQIGGLGLGAMPEWSSDGKWIAFVRYLAHSSYDFELVNSGDIALIPYNGGAFGPAVTVVKGTASKEVHFWPSFSPDNKWLVFNSMNCSGSCQQYNGVSTRLRLVRAVDDSGQAIENSPPIELLAGTHAPNNTNNWPKFAPFLQGGRYSFVVYSARYKYGFAGGSQPQLFMFGLDLDAARKGAGDPSFQPIWLPFQEPNTGNHSAIWTTDVVCADSSQCPSEFQCVSGQCVPRIG